MEPIKTIALVAHDHRKQDLITWAKRNVQHLISHNLICTGTTGRHVRQLLEQQQADTSRMTLLHSGPLGGDQQLGARIAEGGIDLLVFLWDPMEPQPHDVDVKALLRLSVLYNIPTASNIATADYLITSPLFSNGYVPNRPDYTSYLAR